MFNYHSALWEKKRKHILKRDGFLCQYYKRYGRNVEATTVHHCLPVADFPEYAFCNWNLISLSEEAHNKMHNRIDGTLTKEGERWAERAMKRKPPRSSKFWDISPSSEE